MLPKVSRIIKDMKTLKIQGAREVAKAGIRALEATTRSSKANNKKGFLADLQKTNELLLKSRPTEPALRNISRNIILSVHQYHGSYNLEKVREYTLVVCEGYMKELQEALLVIGKIGSEQVVNGDKILTHCHSHSVVEILKEAKKQGKHFEVFVTETRPVNQGIITAKELNKAGIKNTFCVDSAIGYAMKETTKCIVGTDSLFPDGSIVNKIGTLPIAIVAKKFGKPFMAAGGTYKFTPDVNIEMEKRNPKEIIDPKNLGESRIINPAFDVTPAELISLIITEKGAVEPADLAKIIEM